MTHKSIDMNCVHELKMILPDQLFDAHAHIYRVQDLRLEKSSHALPAVDIVSTEYWKKCLSKQLPDVTLAGGLFCPYPSPRCDIDAANSWLIDELKKHPRSRGLLLISPKSDISKINTLLANSQIVGFKPYYFFAQGGIDPPPAVNDFLPEWAWQIAHEKKLVLLIHLVRDGALADEDNFQQLRTHCQNYSNATAILAHAGRGFHAANTVKGISALSGLQNVYFDNSAICEPRGLVAILKEFGPTRLLWGSDFPISEMAGRCVSAGNGFVWLDSSSIAWEKQPTCAPATVGLESIRALKEAGEYFGLNKTDYQNIFCDNAMTLLGMKTRETDRALKLYAYAKSIIPSGTQLMSKRPERYAPDVWPAYFSEARGCQTWDIDGKHYYDMSTNGIGACLLGFRDPDVTAAVQRRMNLGSMSTLNPPEEVDLADMLCKIHPWASQVRFTRSGGETAAVAVRIARATTKRSIVAVCGYHGWHDWYLAANLGETDALDGHLMPGLDPLGVPRELRGTTVAFRDHNREDLEAVIKKYGDRLAAIVMEPARHVDPEPGWLEYIRAAAHKCGALLIFDEITIGFRLNIGGIHLKLGVNPDMALLAKALGNGHPIGAVLGTKESMAGAHQSFISSTYWTESVGPVAAMATLSKMISLPNFNSHLAHMGTLVQNYWRQHGKKHGLPVEVEDGYPPLALFKFKHELAPELMTVYTQSMLEKGFLAGSVIYTTMGHTEEIMRLYGQAIDEVFADMGKYLVEGTVRQMLKGPVAYSGFARLTR
jgi:glutamate-1-semialdehyde 2,1-aminomutase